jgi:hypothetical protein
MRTRPKNDPWRSTPVSERKRKPIELTLPIMVINKLTRMSKASGESRSRIVERLIESAEL